MFEAESTDTYISDKILEFEQAVKRISELKSQNKRVGLCHGGFDLLHPGHVKHFESAKKLCDVLVVSITSDRFVGTRKGSGRPVFSDKLRAYMAANIGFVDFAVITDFEKAMEIIKLLKPSYYIKGPDFINKNTPGINAEREAIKSVNGEMKYTNDPKLSTTDIIHYIKERLDAKPLLLGIDRDGTLIKDVGFLGKNPNWKEEVEINNDVISFISYLQTKYPSTKIVVTNQAGVARRFFDCNKVEEINNHINQELLGKGIKIDNWQYCPHVDIVYAAKHPELNLDPKFVQEKTKRKPNTEMIFDALRQINKDIADFEHVIIIGDKEDDKLLAKNLNAKFVDVVSKTFEEMKRELGL